MMTYAPNRKGRKAHNNYSNIGLQTEVLSASPERLISLLFRGALTCMIKAEHYFKIGDVAKRGESISKAIDIVDNGLKAGLDAKKGGEIAKNLELSYQIIIRNLMLSNLHADVEQLKIAKQMLSDLADAWKSAVDPQFGEV